MYFGRSRVLWNLQYNPNDCGLAYKTNMCQSKTDAGRQNVANAKKNSVSQCGTSRGIGAEVCWFNLFSPIVICHFALNLGDRFHSDTVGYLLCTGGTFIQFQLWCWRNQQRFYKWIEPCRHVFVTPFHSDNLRLIPWVPQLSICGRIRVMWCIVVPCAM